MPSTLEFRVETETVVDELCSQAPSMRVHVIPLIDGEPYIADYKWRPFEALSVYGMDLKDGEVWAFNCECGSPGCAHIDEPMKLTVDGSSVRWKFPDEPFNELAVNADGTPKPRELAFSQSQYQCAFQALISELKSLEKMHGTLTIHPASPRRSTLDEEIEVQRNWAEYRRILRSALGEMDDEAVELVVKTTQGLELASGLSELVYDVTKEFLSAGMYDLPRVKQALEQLGQELRIDPGTLLRRLDVHRLSAQLRATNVAESAEDDAQERWPAPYWTGPDSPREHIDFWIDVQRAGQASLRKRRW